MVYLTNGNKLNKFSQCIAFVPSLLNKKCLLINAISPTRNNTSCISYKFLHLHMENLIKIIKYKLRNTLTFKHIYTHFIPKAFSSKQHRQQYPVEFFMDKRNLNESLRLLEIEIFYENIEISEGLRFLFLRMNYCINCNNNSSPYKK